MNAYATVLLNGLCGAAFAATMAVIFTAPPRYVAPAFLSGLAAQLARDLLATGGMHVGGATMVASAVAVIAAVATTPRHTVVPVVLIAAVLPLGAGIAVFHAMIQLLRLSSAQGPALAEASTTLMGHLGRAFTTFVAIALGLEIGIALVRPSLAWYQRGSRWIRTVSRRPMRTTSNSERADAKAGS